MAILNDEESILPSDGVVTARCFHYPAGRVQMLFTDSETSRFNPDTPEPIEDLSLVRGIAPQLRAVLQTGVWGARGIVVPGAGEADAAAPVAGRPVDLLRILRAAGRQGVDRRGAAA